MTTEIEKTFFDTFGIECNISYHQQFNCAQIPRGLEFYKEREKLEKEGIIKIWHRMLNPRPANDCIYWGEYHYPEITNRVLLKLICIAHTSPVITFVSRDVEKLKEEVLMVLCNWVNCKDIKNQVQAIFKKE